MRRFTFFLLFISLLTACQVSPANPTSTAEVGEMTKTPLPATPTFTVTPSPPPDPLYVGTNGNPWWNDVVFYEVFVRSFYDSDGDGIGDINGLIEKLDYLNDGDPNTTDDLGVTGLWLMPIMVSTSYHGYDVVDYLQVDPDYGTNEDFKRLISEAHARGIRVVVDFVLNHTSSQHPWFKESKNPESNKRDWYIWADENPGYRGPSGQVVWHRGVSGFYYGVFWDGMPDLNFNTPEVTEAIFEAVRFWVEEMDVDGFRLDAIKHIIEEGQVQENSYATHDWLENFYTFYKGLNPNLFTVGEAWTITRQVVDYTGDEVDIAFQFDLAKDILNGAKNGIPPAYTKTMQTVYDSFPLNQYATFLTNHDQNRVMTQMKGDVVKARLAASILLTGPGVPFIYYGEEIGMTGMKPDEDIRLPMQWASNGPKVGFTEGTPWRPAAADFPVKSVTRQTNDPDSLLSHYRFLVQLRNQHEALRVGDWQMLNANTGWLYAFIRSTPNEVILVLMNFTPNPVGTEQYSLELAEGLFEGPVSVTWLFGNEPLSAPEINAAGGFSGYQPFTEIPAQSTHIFQIHPAP